MVSRRQTICSTIGFDDRHLQYRMSRKTVCRHCPHFEIQEMTLLHTIQHPSRLHDVKFCARVLGEGEVLLAGAEDKKLSVYDISGDSSRPPKIIAQMVGHGNRFFLPRSCHYPRLDTSQIE